MAHPKRTGDRDVAEMWMLLVLALLGLVPWIPTLFGEEPAFSASVGAAVTLGAVFLLVPSLRDLWRARREPPQDEDQTPPTRNGEPLH